MSENPWEIASKAGLDLSFCSEDQLGMLLTWTRDANAASDDVDLESMMKKLSLATSTNQSPYCAINMTCVPPTPRGEFALLDEDAVNYIEPGNDADFTTRQVSAFLSVVLDGFAEGMADPSTEASWAQVLMASDMLFLRAAVHVLSQSNPADSSNLCILDTAVVTTADMCLPESYFELPRYEASTKAALINKAHLAIARKAIQVIYLYISLLPEATVRFLVCVKLPAVTVPLQQFTRTRVGEALPSASTASFFSVLARIIYSLGLVTTPALAQAHGQRIAVLAATPAIQQALSTTATARISCASDDNSSWTRCQLGSIDDDEALEAAADAERLCGQLNAVAVNLLQTILATATPAECRKVLSASEMYAVMTAYLPLVAHDIVPGEVVVLLDAVYNDQFFAPASIAYAATIAAAHNTATVLADAAGLQPVASVGASDSSNLSFSSPQRGSGARSPVSRGVLSGVTMGSGACTASFQPHCGPDELCRSVLDAVNSNDVAGHALKTRLCSLLFLRALLKGNGAASNGVSDDDLLFSSNDMCVLVDILLRRAEDCGHDDPLYLFYIAVLAGVVVGWRSYATRKHREEQVAEVLGAVTYTSAHFACEGADASVVMQVRGVCASVWQDREEVQEEVESALEALDGGIAVSFH